MKSSLHSRTFNWALLQLARVHFTPATWSSLHRLTINWPSSKSNLCYDRRSVGQSVLVSSTHLGLKTSFLFSDWQLRGFCYGAPSLTRGRVCLLQCTICNIFTCYYMNHSDQALNHFSLITPRQGPHRKHHSSVAVPLLRLFLLLLERVYRAIA
jgi:hypothetical protein